MIELRDPDASDEPPASTEILTARAVPFDRSGVAVARRAVEEAVRDLGLDDDGEAIVALIVSELATNAILHGDAPVHLTVVHERGDIVIEVADGDPRSDLVEVRAVDADRPGGRGLRLLESLADQWGVRPAPAGKTVWARKHVGR